MPIQTAEILAGARGRILALGSADRFPLLDFLEECERHYPADHRRGVGRAGEPAKGSP